MQQKLWKLSWGQMFLDNIIHAKDFTPGINGKLNINVSTSKTLTVRSTIILSSTCHPTKRQSSGNIQGLLIPYFITGEQSVL